MYKYLLFTFETTCLQFLIAIYELHFINKKEKKVTIEK